MTTTIQIEKLNEVYLRVFADDMSVENELSDYFTYEVPGAKFMPKYKARIWDGKIRLFDLLRKTLYIGLYDYLYKFADRNGYEIQHTNEVGNTSNIELDEVTEFAEGLNLHGNGEPIEIRDYQLDTIQHGLANHRAILLSPTASGKSLIIYTMCRWHLREGRKCLVVVPSTSLVEQMYTDFEDYSSANGWSVTEHCQKLYSGFPKHFSRDILFTTWQSIYKNPREWFDQFDVLIGDEAHLFKATSLTTLMEKTIKIQHKIGTTGSLDDSKLNRLTLEGLFGKVYQVTTTRDLQEQGFLADLKIKSILLRHPDEVCKSSVKMSYQDEVDLLVASTQRNRFISNLAVSTKGNTIVLFRYVEKHGSPLYDQIKEKAGDRSVYFVSGTTPTMDRELIRKILSTETDAIVVASSGVFSTGTNIPSIENIIFAHPTKSVIKVLQSIGRGLRLSKGKSHCTLYDITDDLHWKKSWQNHTLKHGALRYKIYSKQEFPVKIIEVGM